MVAPPAAAAQEAIITRASLEAELGRKLTFRERIAVKTMVRKQKRETRKARRGGEGYGNGLATAGFVGGVLTLLGGCLLYTSDAHDEESVCSWSARLTR